MYYLSLCFMNNKVSQKSDLDLSLRLVIIISNFCDLNKDKKTKLYVRCTNKHWHYKRIMSVFYDDILHEVCILKSTQRSTIAYDQNEPGSQLLQKPRKWFTILVRQHPSAIGLPPVACIINLLRPQFTDFHNKLVFVPGKPFQPYLMFAGKARSLPQSGAPEKSFTWVGSGLTCKHSTRLERHVAYYGNL